MQSDGPLDGGTLFTKHPIEWPLIDSMETQSLDRIHEITANLKLIREVIAHYSQDKLDDVIRRSLMEAHMGLVNEEKEKNLIGVTEFSEENLILSIAEKVRVKVAMDSGAVANVIHPKQLPSDAVPEPNTSGKHFNGAGGDFIERYGTCLTELEGEHGAIGCDWDLADVSRALHSVSKVAGPYEGPGKQDILFNNKRCVVVPPGVLDAIMKHVSAVAEYKREGNLYVAEMTMSSFQRQEPRA